MNYAQIREMDVSDGPGIRVALYVSGCTHRCKGCFNEDTWDYDYGRHYTSDTEEHLLSLIQNPYVAGFSLLGGDPMCQTDDDTFLLAELCKKVHGLGKTVWLWSGCTFEEITTDEVKQSLLLEADVLVDGRYVHEQRDIRLKYKGSANQRVIDVPKSLQSKQIIIYSED